MSRLSATLLAFLVSFPSALLALPPTLVVLEGDRFAPGQATSWIDQGDATELTLHQDADGPRIANALRERLSLAEIRLEGRTITIAGIPHAGLLDQLASIILDESVNEEDALAALTGGLGGAVVARGPDTGGSIRVGKALPVSALPGGEKGPWGEFTAIVLKVQRRDFPNVSLKLRLVGSIKMNALKPRKRVIEADVALAEEGKELDLTREQTQRNLIANYLMRRDRVKVKLQAYGETLVVEDIQRVR